MARKVRTKLQCAIVSIIFFASLYYLYLQYSIPFLHHHHHPISAASFQENISIFNTPNNFTSPPKKGTFFNNNSTNIFQENVTIFNHNKQKKDHSNVVTHLSRFETESVLLQDWEILVIVSPDETPRLVNNSLSSHANNFVCMHHTYEKSPARLSGILRFPERVTFRCLLQESARKKMPLKQPVLRRLPDLSPVDFTKLRILLIWSNLVYDTLTDDDDDDVVVFAKGLIKKQDVVRDPSEFQCIFGDDVEGVRTAVKSSRLEVFRCQRPKLIDVDNNCRGNDRLPPLCVVKVSLEILTERRVVPSVAYYTPIPRKLAKTEIKKALLCACTMVYNVAKFLKEWIYYHSRIGVEKFILYDNGSDDELESIVFELKQEGYDVMTYFWLWQKTQEAGFSHSALYAKESCKWMIYVDVDEFVFSPKWSNSSTPSISMLQSLLNKHGNEEQSSNNKLTDNSSLFDTSMPSSKLNPSLARKPVGQIKIRCHEFGPSNQMMHPTMGVTQGYNCRMRAHNRHKSIVLLEAVDDSLYNVIHHFQLKNEYRSIVLTLKKMMVNHYKYQAWPEFKTKFRRRVSAYVVDWDSEANLNSQDRPKGLGATMIEPPNWTTSYCQVYDNRLRDLVRKWFVIESKSWDWQR
ncbi:hypothetical protein LIER_04811 [Lithospermum erythrorhizon]|uniref:Glycosyltransferase family 92 protein n=1 Tax=Lithospermum erythrorhizon TaxID=34254 RepID=A0AAV3NY26_LITER